MAYNLINLPSQIDSGTIVKANYTYLSDGTKARALGASGAGYDYAGSFTFTHDANNNISLESVAFGTRHANGLTSLSANRWRFSGKEEQDAAFGVPYSDFGARLYDRTAWTAIDPLAEKYYAVSPYAYCNNNPVKIIDPYGLDIYHFDSSGNYIGKTVQKGIHSIAFNTYDENGDPSVIRYFFVDPVNDPSAIDIGEINNLIFVSENEILGFFNSQGAFDSDLTIWDLAGSSVNASAGPKHNFDYSYSELEDYYNGYREDKNVRSSHLFIVEGEKIAQNLMNLGNYLWSATGYSIGVPTPILLLGAQANNLHLIPPKKSAAYAIPRQFDSLDDQLSIIAGARHAKMNDYRGKRK
ncbi:MAG: hypothetical protein IJU63_03445 [Bacteroidales bacterium]|nr:hypothetical protein [Bacteroidales bacterium]